MPCANNRRGTSSRLEVCPVHWGVMHQVSDALQQELGAPKLLAEHVQSHMFTLHGSTAINLAETFEFSKMITETTLVVKEPIGVVGAITPWNWCDLNDVVDAFLTRWFVDCDDWDDCDDCDELMTCHPMTLHCPHGTSHLSYRSRPLNQIAAKLFPALLAGCTM